MDITPEITFMSSFSSRYQRNNKKSGIKNLRCFPHCSEPHRKSGFCGQPVCVMVSLNHEQNLDDILIAEFCLTDEHPVRQGEIIPLQLIESKLRSRFKPTNPWIKGALSVLENQKNRFMYTYEFNSERKGWHYGWPSNKHTCEALHCFNVYYFRKVDDTNKSANATGELYKCESLSSSSPFKIYCRRRSRIPNVKKDVAQDIQTNMRKDVKRKDVKRGPIENGLKKSKNTIAKQTHKAKQESEPFVATENKQLIAKIVSVLCKLFMCSDGVYRPHPAVTPSHLAQDVIDFISCLHDMLYSTAQNDGNEVANIFPSQSTNVSIQVSSSKLSISFDIAQYLLSASPFINSVMDLCALLNLIRKGKAKDSIVNPEHMTKFQQDGALQLSQLFLTLIQDYTRCFMHCRHLSFTTFYKDFNGFAMNEIRCINTNRKFRDEEHARYLQLLQSIALNNQGLKNELLYNPDILCNVTGRNSAGFMNNTTTIPTQLCQHRPSILYNNTEQVDKEQLKTAELLATLFQSSTHANNTTHHNLSALAEVAAGCGDLV